MRKIGVTFFLTILFVLIIPGSITFFFGVSGGYDLTEPIAGLGRDEGDEFPDLPDGLGTSNYSGDASGETPVFNPITESRVAFEDYICGVVAAEMPASYEPEALKAQAVAARTYAYKRLSGGADGATAPNTLTAADIERIDQAYLSENQLMGLWGDSFYDNYSKIQEAVSATDGEIMAYAGEPIEAVFHSSSAGETLDAENVWNREYPYLKGVPSEGDNEISEKAFLDEELKRLLCENISGLSFGGESFIEQFQITSKTDAGYVLEARVGNLTLTGRQIREALGLKSAAFEVREEGDMVIFTTRGYGHGVGMSQNGANFLAENGYDYREILEHYYTGVIFAAIN